MNRFEVGPDGATYLRATGDNPRRLRSEAAFAAPAGQPRLHRVVVVRLRWHALTHGCLARRLSDGKTKPGIMRCLKRHVACEIHGLPCPSGSAEGVLDRGVRAA